MGLKRQRMHSKLKFQSPKKETSVCVCQSLFWASLLVMHLTLTVWPREVSLYYLHVISEEFEVQRGQEAPFQVTRADYGVTLSSDIY